MGARGSVRVWVRVWVRVLSNGRSWFGTCWARVLTNGSSCFGASLSASLGACTGQWEMMHVGYVLVEREVEREK